MTNATASRNAPASAFAPQIFGIQQMHVHTTFKKMFADRRQTLSRAMGGRAQDVLVSPRFGNGAAKPAGVGDKIFLGMEATGYGVASAVSYPVSMAVKTALGLANQVGTPVAKLASALPAGAAAVLWGGANVFAAVGPKEAASTAFREVSRQLVAGSAAVGGVVAGILVGVGELVSGVAACLAALIVVCGNHILSNLTFLGLFTGYTYDFFRRRAA